MGRVKKWQDRSSPYALHGKKMADTRRQTSLFIGKGKFRLWEEKKKRMSTCKKEERRNQNFGLHSARKQGSDRRLRRVAEKRLDLRFRGKKVGKRETGRDNTKGTNTLFFITPRRPSTRASHLMPGFKRY